MDDSNPLVELGQWAWETFPGGILIVGISVALMVVFSFIWGIVYCFAPIPRPPFASETLYQTVKQDGSTSKGQLPCWQDTWLAQKAEQGGKIASETSPVKVENAEVFLTVVVPAYNEQDRLGKMLKEAIDVLDEEYSDSRPSDQDKTHLRKRNTAASAVSSPNGTTSSASAATPATPPSTGWEILIISDGSRDNTVKVALDYALKHASISGSIRVVTLKKNRGKGGAVTHGLRHARGLHVMFADADGASKFSDVSKLISAAEKAQDKQGRAVAVGSRAHLVGSDVVVQRSKLRNFLMHSFHLLLWLLTPKATSQIRDTQCGFKLFTRAGLPYIVPHMHSEGWIFDVEMLMLAERAGIPMVEVPVGWHEVTGSKLNVLWDSLGMAWGLAVLRVAWAMGVYQI